MYCAVVGRYRDARTATSRARDLDRLSPYANSTVGVVHLFCRQYREEVDVSQKVLDEDLNFMIVVYTAA